MGFTSNAETWQGGRLIGINCYELRHAPGIFVAVVTRLTPASSPGVRAQNTIDTGKGVIVSLIVAKNTYLRESWGGMLPTNAHYKPIVLLQ